MEQNLGIVIVTYNPNQNDSIYSKLELLSKYIEYIIVVDNASKDAPVIPNSHNISLIINEENYGHAKALNIGCEVLHSKGAEYALLIDQDSDFNIENIHQLLLKMIEFHPAMIGPQIYIKSLGDTQIPKYLKRKKVGFRKAPIINEVEEVYINITSGSLINLDIWDSVGRFNESLFIEGVDDEYALRLRQNGHKVLVARDIKLYQQYGKMKPQKKFGITFRPTNHSPLRLVYLYRNKIQIMKQYFFKEPGYVLFQILSLINRFIVIMICEENKILKIKAIFKGCIQGILGKKGKIFNKEE